MLFLASSSLTAQESDSSMVSAPLVYLDCSPCDYNHVRNELSFVNYVRDPEMADIHVFVTDEQTGGGGREYEFSYYGQRGFIDTEYTLKHYIDRNATSDEIRDALNRYLKMGFASFMLQTPLGLHFSLDYDGAGEVQSRQDINDPWNHWVFEIYAGSIELERETNQNEFDSRWGFLQIV